MLFAVYFNLHNVIRNVQFYVIKFKKYTTLSTIMDFQKKNFIYFYLNMKEKFISFSKICNSYRTGQSTIYPYCTSNMR